jgi:hypothetical protein
MSRLLIAQYYQEIDRMIRYGGSKNESQISVPFYNLLNSYCQSRNLMAIPQLRYESKKPDGTIKDALRSDWVYWESKDQYDNLDLEIENKIQLGYPTDNILFEDSQTAVLIQQGKEILRVSMKEEDSFCSSFRNPLAGIFLILQRFTILIIPNLDA